MLKSISDKIKGLELYLIEGNEVFPKGWINLEQEKSILIKEIYNKERVILIVPFVEMVVLSNGEIKDRL